jgi:hypothetical protein
MGIFDLGEEFGIGKGKLADGRKVGFRYGVRAGIMV